MPRFKSLLPAFAAVALFGTSAAQSADPVKIRASWVAPVSNWASIWLEKKDLPSISVNRTCSSPCATRARPPMITAMANGELEVANLAYSTLGIAIQNAGLDDIRVIADEFRDGMPGRYTHEYLVLADGPIKKPADLKGKVIGTNAAGSAVMSPPARCCASSSSRTSAIIPWSSRRSRPCARCSRKRRWT